MAQKKLFLLDAMALIYRAHFAFIKAPRFTSKGVNTSAIFGFTNTLLDLLNKEKPTHLAVAFDTHAPTFRHIEYKEYKAQREEVPEDIIIAIPMTKRLLEALNVPILELDGFEADDIIGTLAKEAEEHDFEVYMVTPDKDYCQLVTKKVFLYKPGRAGNEIDILDPKKVEEVMGVPPELIADFLGLTGDTVDNIPGIPKVGPKTAIDLIKQFGPVEEIVKRADEITKPSIQASVKQFGEQGILSKRLATINTAVPISWDEDHIRIGNPNKESLVAFMQEMEFKQTAQRILQSDFMNTDGTPVQQDLFGNNVASTSRKGKEEEQGEEEGTPESAFDRGLGKLSEREHQYHLVDTIESLASWIEKIKQAGEVCFDTETTGLDSLQSEIVAMTMSLKPHEAILIPFPENDPLREKKIALLKELFASPGILKIGQNLKFDMLLLKNMGIEVVEPLFDTMLASYVINADRGHSMDALSQELLAYEPIPISELIGKKGKNQLNMRDVPLDKLVDYACEDADITMELKQKLDSQFPDNEVRSVFEKIEMPLVPVLTQMEFLGILLDENALRDFSKELEHELLKMEKEIYTMAGVKFNINSPKQLGEVLFVKLQLDSGKKTKTGQFSTKEEVLVELAAVHELPALILRFRQFGKLKSTYVDALPSLVNPNTKRLHTTYAQAVAATGRLSSNNPNLQNIPIRRDEGREIRKAFIAEKGFSILSADYSQVELRIVAALSGDEGMTEDFKQGNDVHRATASRVFGVPLEEVTDDMRSKAKMVNFGIIYGISAFGLAQRLRISRTEASEIIKAYFAMYPKIKIYMDQSIVDAKARGYARTFSGRRRYLADIYSANNTIRSFAERTAINSPVQGTAADLIKLAMISIHDKMKKANLKSRMLLQVHDELIFEVHSEEEEILTTLVKEEMENALPLSVPMKVETGIGKNWLEAH